MIDVLFGSRIASSVSAAMRQSRLLVFGECWIVFFVNGCAAR
jgi:hypothetical protein